MKYSEFVQLNSLLNKNNITIEDVKENNDILNEELKNKLYEVDLATMIGGGALLAGLGAIFGKNLIRLGIKKVYLVKLDNIAKKFKATILEKTKSMAQKSADIRKDVYQKKSQLKDAQNRGKNIQNELEVLKKKSRQIDVMITKEINEFITKLSDSKSKEVYSRIDQIKMLKDHQKQALKTYWDGLIPDIRIDAFKNLISDGVLSDKDIIESMNDQLKKIKNKEKQKMNDIQNLLNQKKKEAEQTKETPKPEESKETIEKKDKTEESKPEESKETIEKKDKTEESKPEESKETIEKKDKEDKTEESKPEESKETIEKKDKTEESKPEESKETIEKKDKEDNPALSKEDKL